MNRQDLVTALHSHKASDTKETQDCLSIIALLKSDESCFFRNCFPAHITGSALLLNQDGTQVLMNHHKSLNKWLCFGGHADGEENIHNVAMRETIEESGIQNIVNLSADIIDVDIHHIPANSKKNEPDHYHYHYDIRYAFMTDDNTNAIKSDESFDLQWCSYSKAIDLVKESSDSMVRLIKKAEGLTA